MIIANTEERRRLSNMSLDDFTNELPECIRVIEAPSKETSCELYLLGTRLRNGLYDLLQQVLEGEQKEGDIVIYADHFGDVQHVGKYIGEGRVISKWGIGPVLEHPIEYVPSSYGEIITFLRKP
jgi:hypothetical protein